MKTTKLFLCIALVALTTAAFGHYNSSADIVLESELSLESWMATQFEYNVLEEDHSMESWMVSPFESTDLEADFALESWMVVPFDNGIAEEALILETWMSTPFNAGDKSCMEPGMVCCN